MWSFGRSGGEKIGVAFVRASLRETGQFFSPLSDRLEEESWCTWPPVDWDGDGPQPRRSAVARPLTEEHLPARAGPLVEFSEASSGLTGLCAQNEQATLHGARIDLFEAFAIHGHSLHRQTG
jgi:hypothetical protein